MIYENDFSLPGNDEGGIWRVKLGGGGNGRHQSFRNEVPPFSRFFFPTDGQGYAGTTCIYGGQPMALPPNMRRINLAWVIRFDQAFVGSGPNFKMALADRSEGGTPTRLMCQMMMSGGRLALSINDNIEPDNATFHNPVDFRQFAGQPIFIQAEGDLDTGLLKLSMRTRDRAEEVVLEIDPIDNPVGFWSRLDFVGCFANAPAPIFYDIFYMAVDDKPIPPPAWFLSAENPAPVPAPIPDPVPAPQPEPVPAPVPAPAPVVTNHNQWDDAAEAVMNHFGLDVTESGGQYHVNRVSADEVEITMTPIRIRRG